MNQILLFIGLVIILCLTIKPVGKKLPFPTLLIFIALGMLLGVNGPAHIDFSDYALTETVCSTALLFIMFYGGFNTNIDRAKPLCWVSTGSAACCWDRSWHPPTRRASLAYCVSTACR